VGRVGADHDHAVGLLDAVEVLRARRFAERGLEPVAGRRVADARAGVDVVVAERGAHQLLHEVGLLVGAARTGDRADRAAAVLRLDALDLRRRVRDRLLPGHLAPRIGDARADHRLPDTVLVRRVAPREAALHARMAVVRLAVLVRHHAHDLGALHLGAERAADAAVGTGRHHRVVGLAVVVQRLLHQRRRRARLHAGAARPALAVEEVGRTGGDLRLETAPLHRQRERALHLLARAHAARTDDALGRVEAEVRVAGVLRQVEVVVAVVAVAHLAQADDAGH